MSQLTWEAMNPIDTSRYLDAIQKAQAQSVAGVEQIGNAYKGYQDNLKKQNTNDMLTALNQARNPEELAIAQANIAAMQQRWGSGYDMDAVRTAMDERPAVLMERDSKALQHQQEKARYGAIPQINEAAAKFAAVRKGVTPEMAQQLNALAVLGIDTSGTINSLAASANSDYTTERNYTTDNYWKRENFNQAAYQFGANLNQRMYEFNQTNDRANRESAWNMGTEAFNADQASGAGTVRVTADGTEYTTGGSGGATIANYASKFMPSGVRQAIFKGESDGDYDALYGNSHRAGGKFAGVKLTNMTVNEALEFSKAGGDYAEWSKSQKGVKPGTYATPMGAYQVVGTTLKKAVKALGLKGDEKMTPELQDKIGAYIYQTQGTNAWEGYRGPVQGGGGYKPGNTPANVPLVGIDRKVQQKIRGEYQEAMLKYNEKLALKDQPVNVDNILAGLTAKEKGSVWTQDSFDIVNALKDNPQLKGLSAEGITNVYNRAKAWQSKPGGFFELYNSSNGLKKSIDNIIKDEIDIDTKRKEHIAKASHPSNLYAQKVQQEFEAIGVPISAKEALLHIDPARYQSVKVQEAVEKEAEKVAATAKPETKPTATATAVVGAAAKPKPASNPASQPSPPKPTKQDIVGFYVKRGEVGNVVPNGVNPRTDRQLIREAQAEATKQLKALEAKEKADKEAKKAKERAEIVRLREQYSEFQKQKIANQQIKAATSSQPKSMDINQLRKAFAQQQSLSIANAARKAKEEEERKRK